MDYYSRWIEVDVIRATTSKVIIQRLDAQFARYGMPKTLRTDNGSNLVSEEVEDYLKEMGVKHLHTTPLWPRANGEVERQNRSLLKAIKATHAEGRNWREELNKFLMAYRSTPHSTTGKSPAELLFRRVMKTKMPELTYMEEEVEGGDQVVRDRDAQRKQTNKDYADKKLRAKERDVGEGDVVLLEQRRENKLSPAYEKEPYKVMARYGDQVVLQSPQGVQYRRNLQHVKAFNVPEKEEQVAAQQRHGFVTEIPVDSAPVSPATPAIAPTPSESPEKRLPSAAEALPPQDPPPEDLPPLRRSGRVIRRPQTLNDYVLY